MTNRGGESWASSRGVGQTGAHMSRGELPADLYERVKTLCAAGDEHAESGRQREAWTSYVDALHLLPEPVDEWEAAIWIVVAMGDLQLDKPDFARALKIFQDAV